MNLSLNTVDRIEITVLVDNLSDVLLPPAPFVERPPKGVGGVISTNTLLAEHGLSLLVTVHNNGQAKSTLMDAGYSQVAAPHNADLLGVDLSQVDTMVLSHGHMDHTGAIQTMLARMKQPPTLLMHPAASGAPRYLSLPDGNRVAFPHTVKPELFAQWGARVVQNAEPSLLLDDCLLVTGQVPKVTDFEKGMPNALVERDGQLVQDPIEDDQTLVAHVKGKGLVVVSGCAHSGIINTVLYAQKLSGHGQVHTVMGGFHLSGPVFEPVIGPTVAALAQMEPELIVPLHCTGFKALCRLAAEFGDRFALCSVGTRIVIA